MLGSSGYNKIIGITDMTSDLQKTSMYFSMGSYQNGEFSTNIQDEKIGYIDFSMPVVVETELQSQVGTEDTFLDGYPSYTYIEDVLLKSVTLDEARLLVFENQYQNLISYTYFEDRNGLF